MSFDTKEKIANCISIDSLLDIDGVIDIEYPMELNAILVVMDDGTKYRISVDEENE